MKSALKAKTRALKNDYITYSKNTDLSSLEKLDEVFVIGLDPSIRSYGVGIESWKKGEQPSCIMLFKFGAPRNKANCNSNLTNFNDILDGCEEWWPHINLVIVERQIPGKKTYPLYVHTLSYFLLKCPNAIVLDVSPMLKGRVLEAPPHLNTTGLKKWSVEIGLCIVKERNDEFALEQLKSGKLDDKTDVIAEIKAFMEYLSANKYFK
jgi:hypothetical protein